MPTASSASKPKRSHFNLTKNLTIPVNPTQIRQILPTRGLSGPTMARKSIQSEGFKPRRGQVPERQAELELTVFLEQARRIAQEVAWPTRCVLCDRPGELICDACKQKLYWIDQRWACPVCGAPYGWLTCSECVNDWELRACVSAFIFGDTSARMVSVYKDDHEKRLVPVLALSIATALDEAAGWQTSQKAARKVSLSQALSVRHLRRRHAGEARFMPEKLDGIVFVPATSAAFQRRGFDHMENVARALAAELGIPVIDALMRGEAQDQRQLTREQRKANTKGTFQVVEPVAGTNLLLIDDVITSGASIREAARTLLSRGASSITGASVCRTW